METNQDLNDLLISIGESVEDIGRMLNSRRRTGTPYDRFTVEELSQLQHALKNHADAIKTVKKMYKRRYSN